MKTMSLIDQFGYTMEHMGRSSAEAAEYRERGEWIEARRAAENTEKYRVQAQTLRKRIEANLLRNSDNTNNPVTSLKAA